MSTAIAELEQDQTIDLAKLEANLLPELQGWKEKQLAIVKDNPYVAIEDTSTYEEAKKARTTLVTARTDVQKQEKTIASKLKSFRTKVAEASQELIDITLPHETKQQEEVRRYEEIKEREKAEKERIEQERKDKILSGIDAFYQSWKFIVSEMTFEKIEETQATYNKVKAENSNNDYEEFEMDYAEKVRLLDSQFEERIKFVTEQEEARVERERLVEERAAFEKQQKEAQEKAAAEAKTKAEQEAKEKAAREAERAQIQKEREELEAKKKCIDDAEAERQAKIKAERIAAEEKAEAERKAKEDAETKAKAEQEAKERAEREAKRLEDLKPSKEKAIAFLNGFEFPKVVPDFGKREVNELVLAFEKQCREIQEDYINLLKNLK